jgi:hypothetical protein
VLNRYLGSEELFSRGSVRLLSIIRLAIAEASKPSSRTIMIRRRLVCRAWRILPSLFLFTYSFSQQETSLLKTPRVVSLRPNSTSHAYRTTRKIRARPLRSDRSITRSTYGCGSRPRIVRVLTSKPRPMGLGCGPVISQFGSETALSVMNLGRSTSEIVSRGA